MSRRPTIAATTCSICQIVSISRMLCLVHRRIGPSIEPHKAMHKTSIWMQGHTRQIGRNIYAAPCVKGIITKKLGRREPTEPGADR